jgi:flagellar biosynthetic protein FlhB
MSFEPAMEAVGHMVGLTSVLVTITLVVIAMIDVPFQSFEFTKRMRMTKQEVKDEFKDVEGRPEVKAQIRRKQREMAEARMMDAVKDADVVITNPEHFAVALVYDPESDGAPIVVAKGLDHVALRIGMRPKIMVSFRLRFRHLRVHCISPQNSRIRSQKSCIMQ